MQGYRWREEREWERTAWMTAHIMNATGRLKRPVTVARLLGRRRRAAHDKRTPEERRQEWLALKREFGIGIGG